MRNLILLSLCSSIIACQEPASDYTNLDAGYIPPSAEIDQSLQQNVPVITQDFSIYVESKSEQFEFERDVLDGVCIFGGEVRGTIDWSDPIAKLDFQLEDDQGFNLMGIKGLFSESNINLISLAPEITKLGNGIDKAYGEVVNDETIEITFDKEIVSFEIEIPVVEFEKEANGEWYICKK